MYCLFCTYNIFCFRNINKVTHWIYWHRHFKNSCYSSCTCCWQILCLWGTANLICGGVIEVNKTNLIFICVCNRLNCLYENSLYISNLMSLSFLYRVKIKQFVFSNIKIWNGFSQSLLLQISNKDNFYKPVVWSR